VTLIRDKVQFTRWVQQRHAKGYPFDVRDTEPKSIKTREQEEKYHALIGEIAVKEVLYGKKLDAESWKRLLIDAFRHETRNDPDLRDEWAKFGDVELLPALNHNGFVMVGAQSRRFGVKLGSAFIDWLEAFKAGA
jgi:hypothetical protein